MQQLSSFTFLCVLLICCAAFAQEQPREPDPERYRQQSLNFSERLEAALNEPFLGITNDGNIQEGLFNLSATGVSTLPVYEAAEQFISTLTAPQREATLYPVEDEEWRKWANQHLYIRQGISFDEMNERQGQAALNLIRASLSARGLQLTEDIMHLNETLGELNGNNFLEYGEGKYWMTVMGTPSLSEPRGWQLDGHHLNLNYFVLGDQVVLSPALLGSEPTTANSGKYAGTTIMEQEEGKGLTLINLLDAAQQQQAILSTSKDGNDIMTEAFSDNTLVPYSGIRAADLNEQQQSQLIDLIEQYIGNLSAGHAALKMQEIIEHLDNTYFAWIGETQPGSVFYYRIQSPVVLIEFDHQMPVGLRHIYPVGIPYREHVHAVIRTPNGNDYGKDLLRQHYQQHPH